MTKRKNLLSLLRRQGYGEVPIHFELCADLEEGFRKELHVDDYWKHFGFPWEYVEDLKIEANPEKYSIYYKDNLKEGTIIDTWGVAHEPGSKAAKHMTKLVSPLSGISSLDEIKDYPFPDFGEADSRHMRNQANAIKKKGLAALGRMGQTIWERSWAIRSMEDLMIDMALENEIGEYILDTVTEGSCLRAKAYAEAGVDVLWIGDDIGMQESIMMSEEMYRTWLKPRMKKVIDTAREVKPDILIMYHSCGFIKPFINDLIEIGVDILNPIQPECMSFEEIHSEYGDRLSFHGTIGTQTTMPFGSEEDIKKEVHNNLKIAGDKGGLICAPTHLLEPEVPLNNILAYVEACRSFP